MEEQNKTNEDQCTPSNCMFPQVLHLTQLPLLNQTYPNKISLFFLKMILESRDRKKIYSSCPISHLKYFDEQ